MAALQNAHHVLNDRAARRGDDADAPRISGQWFLAGYVEQTLGEELFLQLLEGQLQGAHALRLQQFDVKLVLAACLIYADAPARSHVQPVLRAKLKKARRLLKA